MEESIRTADEWAREFFTGTFVDLWLAAVTPEQTTLEADFLEQYLQLKPGAKLLDVACGGGRHCVELAGRGFAMTGVDISREFLTHARAAEQKKNVAVAWHERAMHDLPWENQFDGAFCLGNSLGGRDESALVAGFAATARALKPGGRFIVDCGFLAESMLPNLKERPWWELGDTLFAVKNSYDPPSGRLDHEFTIVRGGKLEKKSGFSLVLTVREFRRLFEAAGFSVQATYGTLAGEPYHLGSHVIYLVAVNS